MTTVVPAEGAVRDRILETVDPLRHDGLSRRALVTLDAAQQKMPWAQRHQRRMALVQSGEVLASAQRYDLSGVLDGRSICICGIGGVFADPVHGSDRDAQSLVERLLEDATRDGAEMALLFPSPGLALDVAEFEPLPTTDVELTLTASARRGAPMTLVRGGEDRDLAAIAAMGEARADPFRFHLARDVDFVQGAIAAKRLMAGLGPPGARQLTFVIAEEGITAAAYVVISSQLGTWTIEECGDRDPSGARVGAILQTLIASTPAERPPRILATLPPGFVPPQVVIVSEAPATRVLMRLLSASSAGLDLSSGDTLYWRNDMF